MTVADELKHILCHNITLHELLKNIISEECKDITNDAVDYLPDKAVQKHEIENEIEHANQALITLFDQYRRDSRNIHSLNNSEIGLLVGRLHESTRETIAVLSKTVKAIKKTRKKVINQIKELENKKYAINAYSKA